MSQTKVFAPAKDTARRIAVDGSPKQGSGNNKRYYVGHTSTFDYDSFVQFTHDWTNVGKIVSAILTLYTDDDLGTEGAFTQGSPRIQVRRLTSSFTEGDNEADFDVDDYTTPSTTTSDAVTKSMAPEVLGVNNIDITAMMEDMAPSTVKRRDGTPGGGATNYGLGLMGTSTLSQRWAGVSMDAEAALAAYEPYITLTYEFGATVPNAPTNPTPTGAVVAIGSFQGDFTDPRTTDQLRYSEVQVYDAGNAATIATTDVITDTAHGLVNGDFIYFTSLTGGVGLSTFTRYCVRDKTTNTFKVTAASTSAGTVVNITDDYSAATWSKRLYSLKQAESNSAILADRFDHVAGTFHPVKGRTYLWRSRVYDQEGQVSAWTGLTSFSVTNTDPDAPTLTPPDASSYATLDAVLFTGTFSDDDAGDKLLAYQVQLSAYPEGDVHWEDDEFILWNTGKRYVSSGDTDFSTQYGGAALAAGTYYWRARVWDNHQGVSNWTYVSITLTTDFEVEAQDSTNVIQLRIRAPWRIVIRGMGALRGPGSVVAILEDANNVGASIVYNSPGEAHWTLGINHPQLSVIEPKQTHYAIEFRQGDGWREVFAGLVDDFDASDRDVIFYGIDYLALLDPAVDEHYDPNNVDLPAEKGGSKYVTSGKNSIGYIIYDQLKRARETANSPVGFITQSQSSATLAAAFPETMTAFSTYQPTLPFITGLLNSHRAGTGKRSRISVQKTSAGGYTFVVTDDPGQVRDNLRMRYGEMVQGYRVIPFGKGWATRIAGFGRDKDGVLVRYKSITGPGIDESVWGRWVRPQFYDGVSDANDLTRKVKQDAVEASKLGSQVGLGLRSGVLKPRDGYDVCDIFPVDIEHGSVSTAAFGSGYWVAVGITWTALQQGDLNTILTLAPKQDTVAPDTDLLTLQPISTQDQWQIGWDDPNPLTATSRYWLDQSTGIVYERTAGNILVATFTGSV